MDATDEVVKYKPKKKRRKRPTDRGKEKKSSSEMSLYRSMAAAEVNEFDAD